MKTNPLNIAKEAIFGIFILVGLGILILLNLRVSLLIIATNMESNEE